MQYLTLEIILAFIAIAGIIGGSILFLLATGQTHPATLEDALSLPTTRTVAINEEGDLLNEK